MAELPFGDQPNLISQQRWHQMLTEENLRPQLPEALPSSLKKIIREGWSSDPSERPTADAILKVIDEFVVLQRPSESDE